MILSGANMIKIYQQLLLELKNYKVPKMKIQRMVKNHEIFPIAKGLYETNKNVNPFYLSEAIYSPSYISFQTALAEYGLIPERVYAVTCATFCKHKTKEFITSFGKFLYRDIPAKAYPFATSRIEVDGYAYDIAKPEKALCDMVYTLEKINSQKDMGHILHDNLRIELSDLLKLNITLIEELSELYRSRNVVLLAKYLRRKYNKLAAS